VDSNILVYALDRTDRRKHEIAARVMKSAPVLDCVVPVQVLAEFLNVVRRKHRSYFEQARAQAERWNDILTTLTTSSDHVLEGAKLAERHNLQLWDSIICRVAQSAHAALFLSEDLQDGLVIDGMRVMNPLEPANEVEVRQLLTSADDEIKW
jgi:predicted nucleic acid-binding protein